MLGGRRGNGKEDFIDTVLFHHLQNIFPSAHYGDVVYGSPPLILVIIDDANHFSIDFSSSLDIPNQHLPGRPCTDDHNARIDLLHPYFPNQKNKTVGKTNPENSNIL